MDITAILAIAYRDLLKFLRDRVRVASTLIFPLIFIVILGNSFNGMNTGYSFLVYVFTGVFAQNMFQSTAMGIISLIEDRENDFSQEIFVSPISRYSIIFGKIMGETSISILQGVAIAFIGLLIGVPMSLTQMVSLIPTGLVACLFGGSFGVMVLSGLGSQRSANQIFPFLIFPQFFLAGIFNPIKDLPWYLDILSRLAPMRYAVDFTRGGFYLGQPESDLVVSLAPVANLALMTGLFLLFLVVGTWSFVRSEQNR